MFLVRKCLRHHFSSQETFHLKQNQTLNCYISRKLSSAFGKEVLTLLKLSLSLQTPRVKWPNNCKSKPRLSEVEKFNETHWTPHPTETFSKRRKVCTREVRPEYECIVLGITVYFTRSAFLLWDVASWSTSGGDATVSVATEQCTYSPGIASRGDLPAVIVANWLQSMFNTEVIDINGWIGNLSCLCQT